MRGIIFGLAALSAGCASHLPRMAVRAPNPNGCYVMFFQAPAFRHAADVLNGPGNWPTLNGLPDTNNRRWANQIRSIRVGSDARLTVFSEPGFKGPAGEFDRGSEHADLAPDISANIESLKLTCGAGD